MLRQSPFFLLALFSLLLAACGSDTEQTTQVEEPVYDNPPAPGFDLEGSDQRAIELADSVMMALGGRKSWDDTRYLRWNFFGRRMLLWDKHQHRVRIETPADSSVYIVDLQELSNSQIKHQGQLMSQPDSIAKYAERAQSIWINDAYWIFMPFKLKDSGVTLKYMGQDTTQEGKTAEVIALTFREVGDTPQNKYKVYIEPETYLPIQWDYFTQASDETPRFSSPWQNYERHGDILLSGDRGQRQITDIAVYDSVPEEAFSSMNAVDWPEE